ncbi:MAG TPA: ABC transporter permease [Candidatus Cybelea sp.]|nr:ABC transporter permease [Candidatus Cybelea sp.]
MPALFKSIDRPVLIAFGFLIVMLAAGSFYSSNFLSATYLMQQLEVASFLGIVATGAMIVILPGHIDLSAPWVITIGGMMATAAAGWWGETGAIVALPFAVLCGIAVGVINGLGVAYLRIPSMIFTLGMNAVAQGLMVLHTGGFAPTDEATPFMRWLAVKRTLLDIPNTAFVWLLVGVLLVIALRRTPFGRYVYAIGNRERATYLSGVDTRRVLIICFAASGACSALAGVMLAGYSAKAYQAMGDAYLLPAIAAVVLGGTNILGGSGTYLGTVAGVLLITLLQSILSVMQMPEAGRQVIYGVVIIGMLMVYGRGAKRVG